MACTAVFASEIPFGCIQEIIAEIRGNTANLTTAKKAAWVLGCALEMFDGADNNVIGNTEPSPVTADGIAARLEEICKQEVAIYGDIGEQWRPNPENVKALIELMKTLLPILLPLFL